MSEAWPSCTKLVLIHYPYFSKTWEKAIYHLLVRYRNRHLENYNGDEETAAVSTVKKPTQSEKPRSPLPANVLQETPRSKALTNIRDSEVPPQRPSAPTPTKAQGGEKVERLNVRSVPQGPRPPMSPRVSYRNSAPVESSQDSIRERPRSMIRDSANPTEDGGVPSTPIQSPHVPDQEVQRFFDEVAYQLNTMSVRSSVVSSHSQTQPGIILERPVDLIGQASSPDQSRFADAEGDESDILMPMTPVTEADAFSVHSIMLGSGLPASHDNSGYSTRNPSAQLHRNGSTRSTAPSSRRTSQHLDTTDRPDFSQPSTPVNQRFGTAITTDRAVNAGSVSVEPKREIPRDSSYVYIEMSEELRDYAPKQDSGSRMSSLSGKWSDTAKNRRKKGEFRYTVALHLQGCSQTISS